ncbi:MAG: hypothetical protein UT85_C0013G0008 [Candidatus Levybacteria bacterium GW2011_GWA2_40_16]|nr:MAG: hypothetical protein UT20_C0026G0008 [Candidatus Levybacteria bacterium GW2011_GWA1_39_11]KKR27086.1 MAG: hypothetical protein UT57_C0019G0003 [Microgenomates group bacterium GW2011_GWC1_39_7]KKR49663.1 MAG: hypothetical protein UT85_C0013G0008 [Candidatus Levybacteria bacterium GW2011_GWA2_40_16]
MKTTRLIDIIFLMDIQIEVQNIKKELVEIIIKNLRGNKIPLARAKKLSQDFINLLPISDQQDLLAKLKNLSKSYPETTGIYLEELNKATDQKTDQALSKMRDHIESGNIDLAISAAKDLNNNRT